MFEILGRVLGAGLAIWEHKEVNKYRDKLLSLQKRHREARSKPAAEWDDAVLDDIEFELKILADSFAGSVSEGSRQ